VDEQNRSGNRWEPAGQQTEPVTAPAASGAAIATAVLAPESSHTPTYSPLPGAGAAGGGWLPPSETWEDPRDRGGWTPLALAVAAVVMALVVGLVWLALGRAVAPAPGLDSGSGTVPTPTQHQQPGQGFGDDGDGAAQPRAPQGDDGRDS
jgi:hypothetical protein